MDKAGGGAVRRSERHRSGSTSPSRQLQHPSSDLLDGHAPSLSWSGSTTQLSSPYVPTTPEILLLLVYPTVLIIGGIFGALSLPARLAPYSPVQQSFYPTHLAPSYFALKRNIFNIFFVKIGWFWVSAAFAVFWTLHGSMGPALSPTTPRRMRALIRWAAVTGWWYLVTQWCFGPPLIDRGFRLTGGKCVAKIEEVQRQGAHANLGAIATAVACRAAGGSWAGGHDVSGHVFLLVLGSAFLSLEILPSVLHGRGMKDKRAIFDERGLVKSAETEASPTMVRTQDVGGKGVGKVVGFAMGVIILSWWMLLMTAIYFHTWFEKTTGLLTAAAGLWIVFFLPRLSSTARAAVGIPGV